MILDILPYNSGPTNISSTYIDSLYLSPN